MAVIDITKKAPDVPEKNFKNCQYFLKTLLGDILYTRWEKALKKF